MPVYRFHVDVAVPHRVVAERLKAVVRNRPTWRERFRTEWNQLATPNAPFLGIVRDDSFRVQRDVRRNAFLPWVWGRLRWTAAGTRVSVTMCMQPSGAIFMLFGLESQGPMR